LAWRVLDKLARSLLAHKFPSFVRGFRLLVFLVLLAGGQIQRPRLANREQEDGFATGHRRHPDARVG